MSKNYLKIIGGAAATTIASAVTINRIINEKAKRKTVNPDAGYFFTCNDGSVFYDVKGEGKPILLIHDLNVISSSYEWKEIVDELAVNHKVYTIDLLGCGMSDKPNIVYTNYTYVQIINSFCKEVIKEKCDVVASLDSSSIVLMDNTINDNFENVIIINPACFDIMAMETTRKDLIEKTILCSPIIGTSLFNFYARENNIKSILTSYFNDRSNSDKYIDGFYEAAHINNSKGRYLYAYKKCSYITCDARKAVKNNNNISLILGNDYDIQIANEYKEINPKITFTIIENSNLLPQLENPKATVNAIKNITDK